MPFLLLLLEPLERRDCSIPKIVVRPGIRPVNRPPAPKVRKLLCPNEHFTGFFRPQHPHSFNERFLIGTENHGLYSLVSSLTPEP